MSNTETPRTAIYVLPANITPAKPPLFDDNIAVSWKACKTAWNRFEIATGVFKQNWSRSCATLLSIIGEDEIQTFDTFLWVEGDSEANIAHVFKKFDEPRTQIICKRYQFNNRKQEGENVSTYLTELKTIVQNEMKY